VPGSSFVGVEGTVGVCEREEELERVGRVIARRKRSFSGMFSVLFVFDFVEWLLIGAHRLVQLISSGVVCSALIDAASPD